MQELTLKHLLVSLLAGVFLLAALPAAAQTWEQVAKLLADEGDEFGHTVAISGETAVIGVHKAAYVFVRSGPSWVRQAKLVVTDTDSLGNGFGAAVAISGDTALIGAPQDDDRGSLAGAAYVFVRNGTNWTQQAKLLASDGGLRGQVGVSVALLGNTAVVGARDGQSSQVPGAAYVFVRNGTSWTQQAKLLSNDGVANDHFGNSVSVSGITAVIGIERQTCDLPGAAYVFVRNGTNWAQQAKLIGDVHWNNCAFGASVAVSGDTAVIGNLTDDEQAQDAGSAYVFVRNGTSWAKQAKLTANDGEEFDQLGYSVAVSGDTAVIGDPFDEQLGELSGSAYVFARIGTSWTQQAKLLGGGNFGWSVAVSGDTAVIGNTFDVDVGSAGSAYVFSSDPSYSAIKKVPVWMYILLLGEDDE